MKPEFVPVDLTEMMDEGVLMAANERFFWPLGLALAWDVPEGEAARFAAGESQGPASNLRIREWHYEDGHVEGIGIEVDAVVEQRRARFTKWVVERLFRMHDDERMRASMAVLKPSIPTPTSDAP